MNNLTISGEAESQLSQLLIKTIRELEEYSQIQFGDSYSSSSIYQTAMEIKKEYETICGTTLS